MSLGNASGQPVAEVMGTWTEKMGYPVLSVTRKQVSWKQAGSVSLASQL